MQDPSELKRQSARLRQVILRILEPLFILIASLLLFLTIPYFHYALSIIISLVIAGVAFKTRSVAVLMMFAFAMPGYIYQGGFPPLLLGVVSGTLFIVAMTCIGAPGTALGVATGTVAAMLMFTPLYFLAVPLFVGVVLFRAKGIKVGVAEAILVFLAFYLPFLVPWDYMIEPSDGIAPLFGQVDFESRPAAPVVELSQIFNQLKDSISSNPHIIDNMAIYWPIEGTGRLLGFVLLFTLMGAIFVAFTSLSLIEWFRLRIEEHRHINWWAPTFALLAANLAFLIPVMALKSPFIYEVELSPLTIFGFIVATVVIGNARSAVEHWLTRHERLIDLRFALENVMTDIRELETSLGKHIASVKEVCTGIDLFTEKFVVEKCRQELAFISANIEAMDPATMNDKLDLLTGLKDDLRDAERQVSGKLLVYIDDSRHEYRELLSQATEYGFAFEGEEYRVQFSRQHFPDDETALAEQRDINLKFEELAQILVSSGVEISRMVKDEVDPDLVDVSTDIAQNLYESSSYREAVEASLSAMSTARFIVDSSTTGLASDLDAAIQGLQETIRTKIIPAIESTNDPKLVSNFNEEFVKLQRLRFPVQPGRKLVDRLQVIEATRELSNWTTQIIEQLHEKIQSLEKEIDLMVPSGYSWGKTDYVPPRGREIVEKQIGRSEKSTLDASMAAITLFISTIEQEAAIIERYMAIREFVINYPNIEYLLEEKLRLQGVVRVDEVPVKPDYAMRYLQLYAQMNYRDVSFDSRAGILTYRQEALFE